MVDRFTSDMIDKEGHTIKMKRLALPLLLLAGTGLALPAALYALSDYFTPNETEAADLAGVPVNTVEEAEAAADLMRVHITALSRTYDQYIAAVGPRAEAG